jgi:hypothetical protein
LLPKIRVARRDMRSVSKNRQDDEVCQREAALDGLTVVFFCAIAFIFRFFTLDGNGAKQGRGGWMRLVTSAVERRPPSGWVSSAS